MPRRGAKDWHALAAKMPDVQRWYRHRRLRSKDSASNHLRVVLRTLDEFRGIPPSALLAMSQEELDEFMQDYVDFHIGLERAGSTISKYVDSIKSYLSWHSRELKKPLYIPDADLAPRAEAQHIPSPEKVDELFMACDLRTAVIGAFEAFSAVRPQVLGKSDASDGLLLGDLPELVLDDGPPHFSALPALVKVRKNLSKTRTPYLTFLGPQGAEYLITYLKSRIQNEEVLTAKSPVTTPGYGKPRFMHRGNIQDLLRGRMQEVGFRAGSYILRSYFDNRMVVAESHGVPAIYREFWMGHKGGMQTRYALRKELPPDVIEDMRKAYTKALPSLETRRPIEPGDPRLPMVSALLEFAGYTESQIQELDLASKSWDELKALVPSSIDSKPAPDMQQKVVSMAELDAALLKGWLFKASLQDGRAIIEKAG
jgi:hypothetical protein